MDNRKEREREELHKTIWKIANELRGSVDGWDFKQYVLGLLFYRFISENITYAINKNEHASGNTDFDYKTISDEMAEEIRDEMVHDKGFFIKPSELFDNLRKRAEKDDNLNITIGDIFDNIENSAKGTDSEKDVQGLFDDFKPNDNKLGHSVEDRNAKLVKMLNAIGDLDLGNYKDNTIDLFGDAYEFLMTMYAANGGKSGGEFYTPQEVGELLARIAIGDKKEVNKVYDPACGSGGLLLKFAKILGKDKVRDGFYGQEINLTTYNLARINMFLHDINYNHFNLALGDTLIHPAHWDDEPFDAIVSNPPYSTKWVGKEDTTLINDPRFAPAGILAPSSKADLAFTMHMLSWLSEKGTAAIVEFPGVLYRGGAEQKIRKYMIENNYVDTVIQLPGDLFFGTSIATCILVLKKSKKDSNILFVDATSEYVRPGNKNKLSEQNINNIVDLVFNRKNVDEKTILVSNEDVKKNDYNISVNSYLKANVEDNTINIEEVNKKLAEVVPRQQKIREELEAIIKELEVDYHE